MDIPIIESVTANPLLQKENAPLFDRITAKDVLPAIEITIEQLKKRLALLEKIETPTWVNLMLPLEEIEEDLRKTTNPVAHLISVTNAPALNIAWNEALPRIISFGSEIKQSSLLFHAMEKLYTDETLNPTQKRILTKRLNEAKLSGVNLSSEKKQRLCTLKQEIGALCHQFSRNLLESIKSFSLLITDIKELDGLPPELLNSIKRADGWILSLSPTVYNTAMRELKNRTLREKLYKAHTERASKGQTNNTPLISAILQRRQEMAEILGKKNYAEFSLSKKMAETPAAVHEFIQKLYHPSLKKGREEFDQISLLAKEAGVDLMHWDVIFFAERLKEMHYGFKESEVKPYFPYKKVLTGLFEHIEYLFNIKIRPGTSPVWHPDVSYYIVQNEQGEEIASFFIDPFARTSEKRGGAWMESCINRRRLASGKLELPVAYINCNSASPQGDMPALMTFSEITTLFHEFGHALQHMLTTVDSAKVAGTNGIEWDAVEFPSQFMENWCYDKETLQSLSSHYETKAKLPDELFEKIKKARTHLSALGTLSQLQLALVDLELHTAETNDPHEVMRKIQEKTSFLKPLEENRFLCSFHHIFGGKADENDEDYAAGYYSYKWAEVLSADAFSAFEGLSKEDQRAMGMRFRNTVLSLGGSVDPMEVFTLFRTQKPSIEPLLKQKGFSL